MDTSTVLEKYTQDLANLPLEVKHLLEEIRSKDAQLMDARKRYQLRDSQLHKFIRANGTLTKHPKEPQLYSRIEDDAAVVAKLQKEKILLANTALFLMSKYLFHFETDIAKLERDELLPPVDNLWEDEKVVSNNGSDSESSTPRQSSAATPVSDIKRQKRRLTMRGMGRVKRIKSEEGDDKLGELYIGGVDDGINVGSISLNGFLGENTPMGEDADNNLYCFCQRVSFGEMIGCDNDDCKYEWFHWSCVGISSPPKDDEIWYCPDCAPKRRNKRMKVARVAGA